MNKSFRDNTVVWLIISYRTMQLNMPLIPLQYNYYVKCELNFSHLKVSNKMFVINNNLWKGKMIQNYIHNTN